MEVSQGKQTGIPPEAKRAPRKTGFSLRLPQDGPKDEPEEKEPENGDEEVDSGSEALRNQMKQLQDEVARLSEAGANRGKGPSGIIVSSDGVPEGADKPGEVPVQENVEPNKPSQEKVPLPIIKDPKTKELKAVVEDNQIKAILVSSYSRIFRLPRRQVMPWLNQGKK
jgi:hypothetical protein